MFQPSSSAPRRLALALASRFANRRLIFTFAALAVWSAKVVHIYNHMSAIPAHQLRLWGTSFFAQDVGLLILIRLLLDHWVVGLDKLRFVVNAITAILVSYVVAISIIAVSFYIVAGAEVHWRNVAVVTDASSRAIMLSGIISFIVVVCLTLLFSWVFQDICYCVYGYAADVVNWPLAFVWRLSRRVILPRTRYFQLPAQDVEYAAKYDFDDDDSSSDNLLSSGPPLQTSNLPIRLLQRLLETLGLRITTSTLKFILTISAYFLATAVLLVFISFSIARPNDGSLIFLSWTTALLPFVDFSSSSPTLQKLPSHFGTGIQRNWDNQTALTEPISWSWLPENMELDGFGDWHSDSAHYNAAADPLRISNLEEPLLQELRDKLQDVPVRHVLLFFLESTRNDVFPIKKDGLIWNRLADTFPDHELPQEAQDRLATLTPTANYITGDYDDGFEHDEASMKKRGGVHFTNAHTTATYTLKSMVGTLCGVAPLVADFNLDYKHHIYQPCLPQIFEAMNKLEDSQQNDEDPYPASKWQSYSYQAATLNYDNHDKLIETIGFPTENTIDREYLRAETARHGAITVPDINAFAFEEDPLEEYIRDVFVSAKEKDERVFLTHITSTSHHAFKMPEAEKYVPMAKGLDMFSHYVNAEGYDDKWLNKVLNVLDEQGVADETLIVFVGDHGLSMPENDVVSPYYNPSIGIDHVPLVLSHPKMPAFDVHDAVHSSQILPTILDILLETGSLNSASHEAATDLVHNYEGQSLIRPLQTTNNETGQGNWQFTLVNPGRAVMTVRDARYPERHLVVPIIDNVEWRLSNLTADPREQHAVQGFDFVSFLLSVEQKHGVEVAEWVEEGAFISRWWVEENSKRWHYGPYA
ncbi:hypothetical protein AK830_g4053 [Neonectria ditissima]|uniref:Sulfatase N-terminal domain-containing protein n=1 Tax=Neonectria ditissima TaxID=78410 RepID=A0A0P7AWW1_9HYPO|nr:hypothetical protein AK830_g4053 [Neonectria ditissima]